MSTVEISLRRKDCFMSRIRKQTKIFVLRHVQTCTCTAHFLWPHLSECGKRVLGITVRDDKDS